MDNQSSFTVNAPSSSPKLTGKLLIFGLFFVAISVGGVLAGIALVGRQQYTKSLASNCPGGSVSACTSICISGCGGSDNPTQCRNGCPGACQNICSGGSGYVCGNGRCDAPGESSSNCPQDCGSPATNAPAACAGALQACDTKNCCSGYVCQGTAGSRKCQQVQNGSCNSGGARCGGSQGYIGFRCSQLSGGECNSNAQTFDSWSAATAYAGGCGQADEVWVGGPCNRQLCGNFSVSGSSCSGGSTTPATNPPTTPPQKNNETPPVVINKVVAQCFAVTVYDENWNLISMTDLARKHEGDHIYFAVGGTTTGGSFDKARFSVNGEMRPEVTSKNPNGQLFVDSYVIPSGLTQLSVQAQIHHTTLGWN